MQPLTSQRPVHRRLAGAAAVLALAGATLTTVVSFAAGATTGLSAGSAAAAVRVPTLVMQPRAVDTGLEIDGVVQPVKQSTVAAQTSGRVATLAVSMGDRVRAGQLLATIDDRETAAGLQRS